ncbi:MAG: hypothetical protein BroJett005_18400 [Ignavibacteriota bacterium]|nr:MAG: hypothetical protein BroJett005_18400 [Ignavibacteriota bacterium]
MSREFFILKIASSSSQIPEAKNCVLAVRIFTVKHFDYVITAYKRIPYLHFDGILIAVNERNDIKIFQEPRK